MNELVVPTDEIALSASEDAASVAEENSLSSLSGDAVSVPVSVDDAEASLSADSVIVIHVVPTPYEGEYEVTPKARESVVLPTQNKTLTDNVTVLKVPYFETTNDHGTTVYIAEV